MPETFDGVKTLTGHLKALEGIRDRMEPNHVGRPNIETRIQECKAAIKAEKAARS